MRKKIIVVAVALVTAGTAFCLFQKQASPQKGTTTQALSSPAAISEENSNPVPEPVLEKTDIEKQLERLAAQLPELEKKSEPEQSQDMVAEIEEEMPHPQEDPVEIYMRGQVFQDESLATFPVHTVQVHIPESLRPKRTDTAGRPIPYPSPEKNEIWIRVKPGSVDEMKDIMAQTADLYRHYVQEGNENIRVINWVGGQPWAVATYSPDGKEVRTQ